MKIHRDIVQGTPEWHALRIGKITCSEMTNLVTPKTMKPSASAAKYRHKLLAEWLLGVSIDSGNTPFMQRGSEIEAEAREAYEIVTGHTVEQVGFIEESEHVGGSPDGLIDADGGLEIKCFEIVHHVSAILDEPIEHQVQAQGLMMISKRQWWDLWYYNPILPSVRIRVYRDEEVIGSLRTAVDRCVEQMLLDRERLLAMGCKPKRPRVPELCAVSGIDTLICRCPSCEQERAERTENTMEEF